MSYRWSLKERVIRSVVLVSAIIIVVIANTWIEAQGEQQRDARVADLLSQLKVAAERLPLSQVSDGNADHLQMTAMFMQWKEEPVYRELTSLEVYYIPRLLQVMEQEDENVGLILAEAISEIGKLQLAPGSWSTTDEWKLLWNERVERAETEVASWLADERMVPSEQVEEILRLGAPAIPHLITHLQSGRGSEASMIAVQELIDHSTVYPDSIDPSSWRRWAMSNKKDYADLKFIFN